MRNKGFTLVELLAVISILSLLALITSTVISNSLREAKKDLTVTQVKSIKLAAQAWGSDNINKLPISNSCTYITLQDLIDDGYIESKVINPTTKDELSTDLKIKISSQQNKKNLIYEVNSTNVNGCTYIGNTIHVDLPKGLTPVVYDEDKKSWRVPNTNEEWYNYDEQMWANAVVLGKGKSKNPGEIVTVEGDNPDALMMLVYIPRYEYKIEGDYGTHTNGTLGTKYNPGEIEIKFIKNTQLSGDDGYILHPAFEFGNTDSDKQHLSGIWVGKFELSYKNNLNVYIECTTDKCSETQNLRILPKVVSLRNNTVANFWYGIKSIEKNNFFGFKNIDTHMMKNSEWGAVAYLSQSKYGKYGNNDYDGVYKEIYQNKAVNFITGSSNGTPSQPDYRSDGECEYDDMQDLGEDTNGYKKGQCGPGASTTGNIYGIYDMSGGALEYVMGVFGDSDNITYGLSGFDENSIINSKYYDLYITDDPYTACDNYACFGSALFETKVWYRDFYNTVNSENPWYVRGGTYNSSFNTAGIFSAGIEKGMTDMGDRLSTRISCIKNYK